MSLGLNLSTWAESNNTIHYDVTHHCFPYYGSVGFFCLKIFFTRENICLRFYFQVILIVSLIYEHKQSKSSKSETIWRKTSDHWTVIWKYLVCNVTSKRPYRAKHINFENFSAGQCLMRKLFQWIWLIFSENKSK